MKTLYYIRNTGTVVGNCVLWWREDGKGYTCNLGDAWKVTAEQAKKICSSRPDQDIAYPVSAVDDIAIRHVRSDNIFFRERKFE